jgi:hypothetical protein
VTDAQLLLLYALQTLKNTEGAAGHASTVTRHRQCTCATCSCCSNQHSARAMHPFWPWGSGLLWLAAQVHHLHPAPQLRRAVLRARFLFQKPKKCLLICLHEPTAGWAGNWGVLV